jgi:hypothetical protein
VQSVAKQRLAADDATDVEGEVREPGEAAGFFVKVRDLEQPAVGLPAGMLAGDAVEPALDSAGQPEIRRVDGENERAVDDAAIEPVRQDEFHALDATVARRAFFPLVDPRELVPAPVLVVTDRRADDGGLQAGKRAFQELVFAGARVAPDRGKKLVWRES